MKKEVLAAETGHNEIVIKDYTFEKFIVKSEIDSIVHSLARRINIDYQGKYPLFLIVLKGSIFFAVDILREITIDCEIETVTAKSYGDEMVSSGNVLLSLSNVKFSGKDIIIIEDIIDSGLTLHSLINRLKHSGAKSIETIAFLMKTGQQKTNVDIKYVGKNIPPDFVIGYGLDYAEKGRNLPDIYKLKSVPD